VHPITAVQTEYSLFERSLEEAGIDKTLQELGIGLIAYSPLARGFMSGQFKSINDFPENDFRRGMPKYQGEQFQKNLDLLHKIEELRKKRILAAHSWR
jgi:aryl-alcohol dehydrogenase-like predicted oxidoreductase